MTAFLLRWATLGEAGAHSETPTVEALLAEGWTVAGIHPRYDSVLMRKEIEAEAKALGVSIERPKRAAQRASFRGASRSHRLPFESNGDGPTDIESMIVNRLRGAKKKKSTGKV